MSESQAKNLAMDQGSLNETSRRQGITQGLVHISDETFLFFVELCREVICLQSAENFHVYGENFNFFLLSKLMDNRTLLDRFVALFAMMEYRLHVLEALYHDCVQLFARVMVKQLRKDYLAAVHKKKGMAHRKKVALGGKSTSSKSSSVTVSYADIEGDSTSGKSWSHEQLKSLVSRGSTSMPQMKKGQIQTLCRAYSVVFKNQDTVPVLKEKLKEAIQISPSMPNPSIFGGIVPERQGRKRRAASDEDLSNICRECQQRYQDNEEWIECNSCHRWFHRECAEVFDEAEWEEYKKQKAVEFFCSYC
jgi:hypothetical protein